jgi:hypothetical protein
MRPLSPLGPTGLLLLSVAAAAGCRPGEIGGPKADAGRGDDRAGLHEGGDRGFAADSVRPGDRDATGDAAGSGDGDSADTGDSDPRDPIDFWSIGSYPGWADWKPSEVDYTPFTHIMHFAMLPDAEGNLHIGYAV